VYRVAQEIDSGERVVVGVNRYVLDEEEPYQPLRVDPSIEAAQVARLAELRKTRDSTAVAGNLSRLREAAAGNANVLYPLREALRQRATVGEVCHALREAWGRYQPVERF
jgi:methylmalonyl-CoA mutase, N-terminal domain